MKDPADRRKSSIVDVILILAIIILAYVLYTMLGGDWTAITRLGSSSSNTGFFERIGESLGAFGQGLKDIFGNFAP
jgi:hypothetical protein